MAIKRKNKTQQTKEELKRFKENFDDLRFYSEQMADFMPIAVCTISGAEKIMDANRSFEDLTKYGLLEIMGVFLKNIFRNRKRIDNLIKSAKEEKKIKTIENVLIVKDKQEVPVKIFCGPRKDKEGDLIGYFVSIIDIAESKKFQEKLEKEIKKRTKDLQEKIEELEKFEKIAVGRELRMVELKEEIEKLKEQIKKHESKK